MRKSLLLSFLLLFVAGWVGCGDSTHHFTPTSQLLFVRNLGGSSAAHSHSGITRADDFVTRARPSSVAGGNGNVVMMNNDGSGETTLSFKNVTTATFGAVQLSLDGKMGVGGALDNNGYLQVFVANMADLKNMQIVQLTSDAEDHYSPQLSPDNKTVVFMKYDSTAGYYRAYTISASGGTETPISTPNVQLFSPTFTPDGMHIVFEGNAGTPNDSIMIMNADGSGIKALTSGGQGFYDEFPSVSLDGKTITFSRYTQSSDTVDIYTINIDGTNLKQLTTKGNAWDPLFVNNKIAYVSSGDIYSMNPDGTGQKNLTNDAAYEDFLGWED